MPTIALVDDDRNILTSVSIALEAEGYRIMTYTDGASALDGFKTSPPDLAILDIKMPRMDGMETLRSLRQKSDMPVIFLTSKDEAAAWPITYCFWPLVGFQDHLRVDQAGGPDEQFHRVASSGPVPTAPGSPRDRRSGRSGR